MDIENPLPALHRITILCLLSLIKDIGKSTFMAEGCLMEACMYRKIIEPIQITEYEINYLDDELKYNLCFQLSPDFLLQNYGFLIGGGARLKWKIMLPKINEEKAFTTSGIDWIQLCKAELITNKEFNVDVVYFNETLRMP